MRKITEILTQLAGQQVYIDTGMVDETRLSENCTFDVDSVNGIGTFTPKNPTRKKDDVMSYAGIFSGAWGETPTEVETTVRNLHNEWGK